MKAYWSGSGSPSADNSSHLLRRFEDCAEFGPFHGVSHDISGERGVQDG